MRNRFAMLVETHSWKDYPTRVRITRNTIVSLLSQVAQHGKEWQKLVQQADQRAMTLGGAEFPLSYRTTFNSKTIEFPGYEYTRGYSDVSGGTMTVYDESKPQVWTVPLRDEWCPTCAWPRRVVIWCRWPKRRAWLRASSCTAYSSRCRPDGGRGGELPRQQSHVCQAVVRRPSGADGGRRLGPRAPQRAERLAVRAYRPAQGALVMTMLEPRGADSLLAWGEFNNAFERKEYMEEYVAEQVAREQLEADPALRAEFQKKRDSDAEFNKSPAKRLEFFAAATLRTSASICIRCCVPRSPTKCGGCLLQRRGTAV
jgi:hypothetical protein